ncbi:MAG: FCD domain-containing protein [Hydrogenophaga sp.]|jgi:DNA-binding FadR family transcriptional regulator|nr:FCD domain-containing protein [Hylemonella sp.]MDP2022286.1 FCD domain-containing protein [Hydrogenophaga sp.]
MDSSALLRENILDNLKSGTWRAGHRIPTERALCEQFGIGRSAVRRVLSQLKEAGLISQTVGSGTYVTDQAAGLLPGLISSAPLATTSPAELMEARMALEPAIVEMVVRNATPADFARMTQCCEQAERASSLDEFEHWDGLLHEVIAEAAHNSFIGTVFRLMSQARAQGEWGMLKRKSVTPERRAAYQREHRALVAALRERDLSTALAHTREHLLHVRRNLLGL